MDRYVQQVKEEVLQYLGDENLSIGLFGSRAGMAARIGSDVDILLIPENGWDRSKLVLLQERLENINIPFKVDIVDFSNVSDEFRAAALENVVWWKQLTN